MVTLTVVTRREGRVATRQRKKHMVRLGYRRVSTADQNLDNQQLKNIDKMFEDKLSGRDTDRPGLKKLIEYAREGDTVVVHSIDRLARSTVDLIGIVQTLTDRGATVVFERENLRFSNSDSDPSAKLMLTVFAAIGTFERELMKQRQRAGIDKAKLEGKYQGRKRSVDWDEVREAVAGGMSKAEAARVFGISRVQVYRILSKASGAVRA